MLYHSAMAPGHETRHIPINQIILVIITHPVVLSSGVQLRHSHQKREWRGSARVQWQKTYEAPSQVKVSSGR